MPANSKFSSVSIVIPVYNGASSLPALVDRLDAVLSATAQRFEVIMVNDGSQDNSWQQIETLAGSYSWVRGICLMRNFGQHNALLCGIRAARHELTITLDDDLQNPPEEIPNLLRTLEEENFDLVYGYSADRRQNIWRNLASQFVRLALAPTLGKGTAKHVSSFRAFRTAMREGFAGFHGPFVSIDVLLGWAGERFGMLKVRHDERQDGVSTYSLTKLVDLAMTMLLGFSTAPLRLASITGIVFLVFGGLILMWVIGRYLVEGGSVPGFPFLASIIALFAGAQLFSLGVIGEYLARMHQQGLGKPPYVIAGDTNLADDRRDNQ